MCETIYTCEVPEHKTDSKDSKDSPRAPRSCFQAPRHSAATKTLMLLQIVRTHLLAGSGRKDLCHCQQRGGAHNDCVGMRNATRKHRPKVAGCPSQTAGRPPPLSLANPAVGIEKM